MQFVGGPRRQEQHSHFSHVNRFYDTYWYYIRFHVCCAPKRYRSFCSETDINRTASHTSIAVRIVSCFTLKELWTCLSYENTLGIGFS